MTKCKLLSAMSKIRKTQMQRRSPKSRNQRRESDTRGRWKFPEILVSRKPLPSNSIRWNCAVNSETRIAGVRRRRRRRRRRDEEKEKVEFVGARLSRHNLSGSARYGIISVFIRGENRGNKEETQGDARTPLRSPLNSVVSLISFGELLLETAR